MKILLDSNMLVTAARYKVDLLGELRGHELLTLDSCLKEIERLARGKSRSRKSAAVALQIAKRLKIEAGRKGATDAAILEYAVRQKQTDAKQNDERSSSSGSASSGFAVATNDRALIKALKNNDIKVIRLRQRKKLIGVTE